VLFFLSFFRAVDKLEQRYINGELTASAFLDEAQHFFDSWKVDNLSDSWNEEYGQYIVRIDEPANVAVLDDLNRGLSQINVADENADPDSQPAPLQPAARPALRSWYPGCSVCNSELDHDNWWICLPCFHCFCRGCTQRLGPVRMANETEEQYRDRSRTCFTCQTPAGSIHKIHPNYVVCTHDDLVATQASGAQGSQHPAPGSAAASPARANLDEGAQQRLEENRRILADLLYSNDHRQAPRPNSNWDTLQDEMDLEVMDQTHSQGQPSQARSQGLPDMRSVGSARPRGRGPTRARGARIRGRGAQSVRRQRVFDSQQAPGTTRRARGIRIYVICGQI
jgi:hypothetical protein